MNRFRLRWWTAFAGLSLSALLHADFIRWQTASTPNLLIHYTSGQEESSLRIADRAESSLKQLRNRLLLPPAGKIHVYLYPQRRLFLKDAGVDPHLLVVGLAYGRGDTIRLDASELFEKAHPILTHEMVHILLHRAVRGNGDQLPLWMNEGLAKYLSDGWNPVFQDRLADAVLRGKLIPLNDLHDRFPQDPDSNALAYLQGTSFVAYLDTLYGEEAIPKLISLLGRGYGLHKALMAVFGSSLKELEDNWKDHLRQEYRWTPWTSLLPWAVGMIFVALSILAYRTYLRRRRHLLEKWEEEERMIEEERE